jgi:predicted HicB family RNase H-like nuclease
MASQGKGSPSPNQDEGATARINFRPPEHLKARIEDAAGREGLSVNAWLVLAVTATLNHHSDPVSRGGQHYSGWVR